MPQTRPVEYVKAFLLNVIFFVVGIGVYVAFVPTHPIQLAGLIGLSALALWLRMRLIRVEDATIRYEDETLFLTLLDGHLTLKDRWKLAESRHDYRRYEARMFLGLYRFTAVLEVYPQVDYARLRGHNRILTGVLREMNRPQVTGLTVTR